MPSEPEEHEHEHGEEVEEHALGFAHFMLNGITKVLAANLVNDERITPEIAKAAIEHLIEHLEDDDLVDELLEAEEVVRKRQSAQWN